jgi:hypothetical protein
MNLEDSKWIQERLPQIDKIQLKSEADYYGASSLIAEQLGLKKNPRSFAHWMHGWLIDSKVIHPRELTCWGEVDDTILVATLEQENTLREFGYQKVYAVGLPFIYGENTCGIKREPNSLLVMPNHSSEFSTNTDDQELYIKSIASLKTEFSKIIVSIHGSCLKKGYWLPVLEKYNLPWIVGASTDDKNAMKRMHNLFSSFEYVTTNTLGSHVLYASYKGCKVSIYGSYYGLKKESYSTDPWYQKYPEILEKRINSLMEENIRSLFPWLFVYPTEANSNKFWASTTIGEENKLEPKEVAELLGWPLKSQIKGYSRLATEILRKEGLVNYLRAKVVRI